MKLKGTKTEADLRRTLMESQESLRSDSERSRILDAVRPSIGEIHSACVLEWIPEQGEDILKILVNGVRLFEVEADRVDTSAVPLASEIDLGEYESALTRAGRLKLAVARDIAMQG